MSDIDLSNESTLRALEEAARNDPRFKLVEFEPGCYTYIDLDSGLPEENPQGGTAELAFALTYLI